MDYLQYKRMYVSYVHSTINDGSFKPCYKWITFNTKNLLYVRMTHLGHSFKPCYKWITFNTYTIN